MKNVFFTQLIRQLLSIKLLIVVLLMPLFFSCGSGNKELSGEALQKEKDAILAVIEKETSSFFARDYDSWKSTFIHENYAFQAWSNQDGTFDASVGWDGIDKSIGTYINDNPVPDSAQRRVERKNIVYKFYGSNVAFLTWDQFNSDRGVNMFLHSKETRLMEKINGEWKIVEVSAFWDYKNPISGDRLKDIERMDKESRGKDKL
ncbi:MAG: hypothetical protein ACK5NK_05945 [Niabella sp.]